MNKSIKYKHNINLQIKHNQSKNLLYNCTKNAFSFAPETIANINLMRTINSQDQELLINYTVQKVIREFCRINQYMSFSDRDKESLSTLYSWLFHKVKENKESHQTLSEKHYQNVRDWLIKSNPFVQELYSNQGRYLNAVCCSEYNADLQIKLLHIDLTLLSEPILDIGCGEKGILVHYLREKGLDAYGIDRFSSDSDFTQNTDWLEYNYGKNRWGTIISNLGFSNHFYHHHLRKNGDHLSYAKKYMEILHSLKPGGLFHYAPALPFIEQFLDDKEFQVSNFEIKNLVSQSTIIKRRIRNVE